MKSSKEFNIKKKKLHKHMGISWRARCTGRTSFLRPPFIIIIILYFLFLFQSIDQYMEASERKKNERLKSVRQALQQLLEERRQKGKHGDDDEEEDDLFLSKLLLQVPRQIDSLGFHFRMDQINNLLRQLEISERDAIAEEMRAVRRQNLVTHRLLSALIVMSAVWQLKEVSLLLMAREKLRHPLKAIVDAVKGLVQRRGRRRLQKQIETNGLPPIPVPDLARVDLPPLALDCRR